MTEKTTFPATDRRAFLGAALALSALPGRASADERDFTGRAPVRYPDPAVAVLDPRFARYQVFDVVDGRRLANGRTFTNMELGGRKGGADGIRADVDGNVWAGAGWAGEGYDGCPRSTRSTPWAGWCFRRDPASSP